MYNQSDLLEMLRNLNSRRDQDENSQDNKDLSLSESINLNSSENLEENPNQDFSENSGSQYNLSLSNNGRASTAPVKQTNCQSEFNWNFYLTILERCVILSDRLILKNDNKFDVDSEEGSESCKKFLDEFEKLIKTLNVQICSRDYINSFSKAYKFLYKEGSLCYLTEILDSAQEAIPCLWVNGEKYNFSNEVLESGDKLFNSFCELLVILKNSYSKSYEDSFFENSKNICQELKSQLLNFDKIWVAYEEKYISELIQIEKDSRKLITAAIAVEKDMTTFEVRAKCLGKVLIDSEDYNTIRKRLVDIMAEINKVANVEGKGRDDLTINILIEAESIMRRISSTQCKSIRFLAEKIKQSFMNFRILLRKFEENLEVVDPQLKNNSDLVECMFNYEVNWEKGKEFLLSSNKCNQLIDFSQIIEILCEKYKEINDQVENRDPSVFVWIPSIVILKALDADENENQICKEFNPNMFNFTTESGKKYQELKILYKSISKQFEDSFVLYNILEKSILFEDFKNDLIEEIQLLEFDKIIKILAMQLQRNKPSEWNNFIDLSMNFI